MRSNIGIIVTTVVVLLVLVGLNAASYVEVESAAETESAPNRSTTNGGTTGTRAFYELLEESGYKVLRWREPLSALVISEGENSSAQTGERVRPATLVIIGRTRRVIEKEETESLLQWVEGGGRLVIVDRNADSRLFGDTDEQRIIATREVVDERADAQQSTAERLVAGVEPLAPAQPTLITRGVERILPSRFAARFSVAGGEAHEDAEAPILGAPPPPANSQSAPPAPPPPAMSEDETNSEETPSGDEVIEQESGETEVNQAGENESDKDDAELYRSPAPVAHFSDGKGALLLDYPYGRGRIILLGDPFLVANNGINRADNALLAINLVGTSDGVIAFDEYHQGLLPPRNEIVAYFRGTPALALCTQTLLLIFAFVWSRSRRFARPLPVAYADRRSKLEFISSLAELLKRARAYDLAVENIYRRTRPALARFGGTSPDASRSQIAAAVSTRANVPAAEIENLMRECEDCINGAPVAAAQALDLAGRLRRLERKLNLRKHDRHAHQPARDSRAA